MRFVPAERHLLQARDLVDARYAAGLDVDDMARAAGLSRGSRPTPLGKLYLGVPPTSSKEPL